VALKSKVLIANAEKNLVKDHGAIFLGETGKMNMNGLIKQINMQTVLCLLLTGVCWAWEQPTQGENCSGSNPRCSNLVEVPLFGTFTDSTVSVGECCSSAPFELGCGSACGYYWLAEGWNDNFCHYFGASLPGFLGSSFSIDWGMQGPNVKVSCDTIFPARGQVTLDEKLSDTLVQHFSVQCVGGGTASTHVCAYQNDSHYFMAIFDPNVFTVNGFRTSPLFLGSSPTIVATLVNSECETLQKALDSKVTLYHQKWQRQYISMSCDLDSPNPDSPLAYELTTPDECGSIGVEFIGDTFGCHCPHPSRPTQCPIDGSSGCSTGTCGTGSTDAGGLWSTRIGNASVAVNYAAGQTLSMYGSPDINMTGSETGKPEINIAGTWLRATHFPYQASTPVYSTTQTGDVITEISYSFHVTDGGYNTYHYAYELAGNWGDIYEGPNIIKTKDKVALEAFLEEARGKVRLTHVTNVYQDTIIEYDYSGGNIKQTSKAENGTPNGYVIYDLDNNGELMRIWVGVDQQGFQDYPNSPVGGRWVDLSYSITGTDGEKYLDRIEYGGCSFCREARVYEKGGPDNTQLTAIKKIDGTVLATYDYDIHGNYKSYSLGGVETDLKVNEWERSYYDPGDPNQTTGDNIVFRKDYVDNNRYRAKVFFADDNGALIKEIHYHNLQDDPNGRLHGAYSVYRYYHEYDETEGVGYVTEYPKGNKRVKYYDENDNVVKVLWVHDALHPEVAYAYQTITYGDDTRDLVQYETNSYGGITTYTYEGFNIKTQTEPVPSVGISGGGQQITGYEYGNLDRVDYEYKKDSTGIYVYTKYVYDGVGNLKRIHENCTDYDQENPLTGLITSYDYNDYNELIKTTYPSGRVERKFYSDAGTVIAEAVYEDDENDSAVSATIYEYEDGKLRHKKTAKMNAPFTFTESIVQAGGEGVGITWIQESYNYDINGRKEAVIADSGTGGQSLRTEYEYNNQGEITRILQPDKRYKRINRDGRGLVAEEITGVLIEDTEHPKATTKYFYDLNGNMIRKVDPVGVTEIYQYDAKDHRVRVRHGK
jgi:YD repeat-containing protein